MNDHHQSERGEFAISALETAAACQQSVALLLRHSQTLWDESSFDALVSRFAKMLVEGFGARGASYFKVSRDAQRLRLERLELRAPRLADELEAALIKQLASLEALGDEAGDGVVTLRCADRCVAVALLGDFASNSEAPGALLAWEQPESSLTMLGRAETELAGDMLDFLTRQLQGGCRWFRKLDSAQAMLYRDDLTGLFNYRYLDVALDSELRRAQRFATSFCLLFIDLDNFKQVNDRYGHLSGSSVLKQVGSVLRGAVREVDAIIRYGGDEYVVILLGASSRSAIRVAERIRRGVEKTAFKRDDGGTVDLTVSIGVAAYPEHGRDKETLLRLADATMYKSKRSGKNRVTMVDAEAEPALAPRRRRTSEEP